MLQSTGLGHGWVTEQQRQKSQQVRRPPSLGRGLFLPDPKRRGHVGNLQ